MNKIYEVEESFEFLRDKIHKHQYFKDVRSAKFRSADELKWVSANI
jgi:hypothetical protein